MYLTASNKETMPTGVVVNITQLEAKGFGFVKPDEGTVSVSGSGRGCAQPKRYDCACMHTCIHAHMHTYVHPCTHAHTHTCIHTFIINIYTYTHVDVCTYICACICVCVRVCVYVRMFMNV